MNTEKMREIYDNKIDMLNIKPNDVANKINNKNNISTGDIQDRSIQIIYSGEDIHSDISKGMKPILKKYNNPLCLLYQLFQLSPNQYVLKI